MDGAEHGEGAPDERAAHAASSEGRLREAYRVEGEFVDATLFGLLVSEWCGDV